MLRTICFLLSLPITLVCCALFVFYFLYLLRWCVAHYLFSTFFIYYVGVLRTIFFLLSLIITLACCTICFLVSSSYVGVLRTICFLVSLTITLVCCAYLFSTFFAYYVGVLRTICFLVSLSITLVCCALFWFYFLSLLRWCVVHCLVSTFFD